MNIWLVTTGSSDVQLKTDEYWRDWYDRSGVKSTCHNLPFQPIQTDEDKPYRVPPRVLGRIYQAQPDEVWKFLEFPLLQEFTTALKDKETNKIILLLTDQSSVFSEDKQEDKKCPFWQDTGELEPVFKRYFQDLAYFSDTEFSFRVLLCKPGEQGLDDWDHVLNVVQRELDGIKLEAKTVYVSHQAGTPAISSAIQFVSLAKFGDRVKFLVSNEYNEEPAKFLPSSNYLRGIKLQQANKLLERYDYSGVKELIWKYLNSEDQTLLDAAIQWNFAEFHEFTKELKKHPKFIVKVEERIQKTNWWWTAFEAAWLGVVRLEQENIVEAMFHSFRAFEGIFSAWGQYEFSCYIEIKKNRSYLMVKVLEDDKVYFSKAKFTKDNKPDGDLAKLKCKLEKDNELELNLSTLCTLFRACREECKKECKDLSIFWKDDGIHIKRNLIFHQLQGMSKEKLWEFWEVSGQDNWESRILAFLNFIAKQDSVSLQQGSLMFHVHEELKAAIAHL